MEDRMPEAGIHRKGEVSFPKLLEGFKGNLGGDVGAIGCFIGVVRGLSKRGEEVRLLRYEAAQEAPEKLLEIAGDVEGRPGIARVAIHHVIDEIGPGEDAIYVLVAGRGRREVFEALPEVMDRVKAEVPIWKKEITERGEYWAHELK